MRFDFNQTDISAGITPRRRTPVFTSRMRGGRTCTLAPQLGKPVSMALFDLNNQGKAPVTIKSVSLPNARGMAMTEAWLLPIASGPQLGVGFGYPPVTFALWADRVPVVGAVIPPGEDLSLVFGVLRTTAADGSSDGPMIVYTAGGTTSTLDERVSLAVAATKCALFPSPSQVSA